MDSLLTWLIAVNSLIAGKVAPISNLALLERSSILRLKLAIILTELHALNRVPLLLHLPQRLHLNRSKLLGLHLNRDPWDFLPLNRHQQSVNPVARNLKGYSPILVIVASLSTAGTGSLTSKTALLELCSTLSLGSVITQPKSPALKILRWTII